MWEESRMRKTALVILAVLLTTHLAEAKQGIDKTVHNLSRTGPGLIKSSTASEVCKFCHTPHGAAPQTPGWNRNSTGQVYVEYDSTTMQAVPQQPAGSSQMCLSCHDGTVALGLLRKPVSGAGRGAGLLGTFVTGRGNLNTDLSDDHPISFTYSHVLAAADGSLANPDLTGLPLEDQQMECGTCHDAHEKDVAPFLRRSTANGELCLACHLPGGTTWSWSQTSHANSSATDLSGAAWQERKREWRGANVAENSCFNCHVSHSAPKRAQLIKKSEEETCYLCHKGGVASSNILRDMHKPSRHRVAAYSDAHETGESFSPSPPVDHVECEDCHNPHAVNNATTAAPLVSGALAGVSGVDSAGIEISESTYSYEICYKCHGDNHVVNTSEVVRQIQEFNTRLEFDLSNPSYHPVEGPGRNDFVPSLISPMTPNSQIYCTDCHSSNSNPSAGGVGAKGPHGSIFEPLLERNYQMVDGGPESSFSYALCYKCHDRSSILGDESFPGHRKHVVDERTPCSACHDAHGIDSGSGNAFNNSHLINFDLTIVSETSAGQGPLFEHNGHRAGQCFLSCHDTQHDPCSYNGSSVSCEPALP